MNTETFESIKKGLEEAIAHVQGEPVDAIVHTPSQPIDVNELTPENTLQNSYMKIFEAYHETQPRID